MLLSIVPITLNNKINYAHIFKHMLTNYDSHLICTVLLKFYKVINIVLLKYFDLLAIYVCGANITDSHAAKVH